MDSPRRERRRGFSLVESVVVIALIGIASSAAVYWAARPGRVDQDISAKAALSAVYDAEINSRVTSGPLLDAQALQTADPSRRFVDGESTGPDTISVSVEGTLVHAAARNGVDCWALRLETAPSAASPRRVVWFVLQDAPACSAEAAAAAALPTDGSGSSLENPAVVVSP